LNDCETTWQQLIDAVAALESKILAQRARLHHDEELPGRLNLVQPFKWMDWTALPISEVDLDQLDIHHCTRHVTRLVRADRFSENLLFGWIRSGHFRKLCEAARRAAAGNRAPYLPKAA